MWRREDITECCFIGQKQDQGELAVVPTDNVGCSPTQRAVETWEACCHWKSSNCGHRTRCQYMIEKREDLFLWMVVVFDGLFQVIRNWNEFVLFAHPRCLLPSDKSILHFKWDRLPLPSSCVRIQTSQREFHHLGHNDWLGMVMWPKSIQEYSILGLKKRETLFLLDW